MSHRAPSFLASPRTEASGSRGQYNCDYHDDSYDRDLEVEDDNLSHHPSNQGGFNEPEGSPPRSQFGAAGTLQGGQSVRRPPGPPGPGDQGSRFPEAI